MANSQEAFKFVMKHEDSTLSGVVVQDNDGGQVRFGVNSNANPLAIEDGFYQMNEADAYDYAFQVFIVKYWWTLHGTVIRDQRIANQLVDMHFVSGDEAVKLVQLALNLVTRTEVLKVDGVFGTKTLAALNTVADPLLLLDSFKARCVCFFQQLVKKDPVKYSQQDYLSWVGRLNA